MGSRTQEKQSKHDEAVQAAGQIYRQKGKHAWLNPGGEKNKEWCERYVDVIAVHNRLSISAWVIEIETEDSVSENEARSQWKDYDGVYSQQWYLAVPVPSKATANTLIQKHAITHCTVLTWQRNTDGTYTFWGLPGLN